MESREILQWQEETDSIIQELLDDGSDPDAVYTIEHHFTSSDWDALEKTAVNCFKAGYEVTDAEEAELDDGAKVISFDVVVEMKLKGDVIKSDIETLAGLVANSDVFYDGWGTYFEGDEDFDESEQLE